MTPERYQQLCHDHSTILTDEEYHGGWHFCMDWDGMLIHTSDKAYEVCGCIYKLDRREG